MKRIFIIAFSFIACFAAFAQDHDAELVYQETNVTVRNGILCKTFACEIKIFNRGGENLTKISIPYSKLSKVSKIEAYLKDKNGVTVRKLEKGDITEKSAIADYSFYEDSFTKEFTLKHNSYPYSIYYTYQLQQEEFIYLDYWMPVIDRETPTLKAVLKISVPKEYKILYSDQGIESFKSDTSELQINYTWTASYTTTFDKELFAPPIGSYLPYVAAVPLNFNYFVPGSFLSWQTFGDWQWDLIQGISELPQYEKNTIDDLIAGVSDEVEKIRILYHYLQDHTRYINITIETGGLKPYPATYVAENKYGDCKALANYFRAVLDHAGIKSFYTVVNAGEPTARINRDFPSQQFNHVILNVPMEKDTIWLDCTTDGPFNYLGTFSQGRDVFVIEKNNSHLARTPALTKEDVKDSRRVTISKSLQDDAIAEFLDTYRGENFESLFHLSNDRSESDKAQIIRNNFIDDGFEVVDFNLTEAARDVPLIQLSYSARSGRIYNVYGNELIIKLVPFSIPDFEKPGKRKLPVQLDYPIFKIDTLDYQVPLEYAISDSLQNWSFSSEFGRYDLEFSAVNGRANVIKSFLLYSGYIPVEKYNEFYDFIKKVKEYERNNAIVATTQ